MDVEERRERTKAIGEVLAVTGRFDAARLRDYQFGQIEQLARHAIQHAPFYRDRLAPLFRTDGSFDFSRWSGIPVLTRADIKEQGDAMIASDLPAGHGPAYEVTSSGTTGTPIRILNTALMHMAGEAAAARSFGWYGLNESMRTCTLLPPQVIERMNPASGNPDRQHVRLSWATPPQQILDVMERHQTSMLTGLPPVMEQIGELQLERRAAIPLKVFVGTTMATSERARQLAQKAFGAVAYATYSSSEAHKIAHECSRSRGLHVNSEIVLVEIVDDRGNPCAVGEPGRVIVTPFLSTAQPLIRYEQGDIARWGAPCPCGRAHPVIAAIEGRIRDQFRFADGPLLPPAIGYDGYVYFLKADRWQVAQTGSLAIEVRFVSRASDEQLDFAAMTALFRKRYHPALVVSYRRVDSFELPASGKFRDYVNEMQ